MSIYFIPGAVPLKNTLKTFDDFKKKQQKCMEECLLICKSIYLLKIYLIHYILQKNANVKKIPSDKINVTKNALFFLSRTSAQRSFTFNWQFLYELKHRVYLSNTVCGIFHFRFRFLFLKVYIFV